MLFSKDSRRKRYRGEGEKPFWISLSDLMTALMVLFLIAMAVSLSTVTKEISSHTVLKESNEKLRNEVNALQKAIIEQTKEEQQRQQEIDQCMSGIKNLSKKSEFQGIVVRGNTIDFGTLIRFKEKEHVFEKPADETFVRKFVPNVLNLARTEVCTKWLKRVVVEGFASKTGDYLFNLNLSYLRSQRVLCALLNSTATDALPANDRAYIQTLFLVGGSSFNTEEREASQMRRVEMKLEFRDLQDTGAQDRKIPLDPGLQCPNDRI
jgi:outer membrane protein OmpA-like peptidoglycan-associated protein